MHSSVVVGVGQAHHPTEVLDLGHKPQVVGLIRTEALFRESLLKRDASRQHLELTRGSPREVAHRVVGGYRHDGDGTGRGGHDSCSKPNPTHTSTLSGDREAGLIETLVDGGPVMIPILACSVVALATFFERIWSLRRARVVPRAFNIELVEMIRQDRWNDAITLCKTRDVAIARILQVALEARDETRPLLKERVEEVGRREAAELERFVPVLGTIASISPLLGLLGTVGGMILTFQVIEQQGVEVGALAGGISQALITTFAGLSVGIPALVANRYVLARVDGLVIDLEEVSLGVVNLLASRGRGARGLPVRFVSKRRADPLIDVTPMIDIVFQLVLFFMVSTTFVQSPGIQVDLPRSSAQTVLSEDQDLHVWMTVDGAVYLDEAPVTAAQLRQMFERRARSNPNTLVVIKADTGVSHGRVVAVMDQARAQGLSRLAIATDANAADDGDQE